MESSGKLTKKDEFLNLDFGEVEVGKAALRSIQILNESRMKQTYEVFRDSTTNPLDYVFNLASYSWSLSAGEAFQCDILYQPIVSCIENVDYILIQNSTHMRMRIVLRGRSIGPRVSSSESRMFFNSKEKKQVVRKCFKLINDSLASAYFVFDIDRQYETFKLDCTCGVLLPHSQRYITVSFRSEEKKLHVYYLTCLILNQEPVTIELYGYCGSQIENLDFLNLSVPLAAIEDQFDFYMCDTVNICKSDAPLVSLSKSNFDLGQATVSFDKNTEERIAQIICLTNHKNSDATIEWENDKNEVFKIMPCKAEVRSAKSILFEITFDPNRKSTLFTRNLLCRVRFKDETEQSVPFITSIRAIGHSFDKGIYGWIPQYEIPQSVVLPPCVPSHIVHASFLIKKFGHLPLMFHFVPPRTSHFTVKPLLGIINENFQVIIVQMHSNSEKEYIERWAVHFNGNSQNESFIDLKGYVEYPMLTFNQENLIDFPTVHPFCEHVKIVAIRNITRHAVKFEFIDLPSEIKLPVNSGIISSNDTLEQRWIFHPEEIGLYNFQIHCKLFAMRNEKSIEPGIDLELAVSGNCEYGNLVANPKELNFGIMTYGETREKYFYILNLSTVNIHYKIECIHQSWPVGCIKNDIKVYPNMGSLTSGTSEKTMISITPHSSGFYEFFIQYYPRINSESQDMARNGKYISICKISGMSVLPTLKVIDLYPQHSNCGIGKTYYWIIMKINELNQILENILPDYSETLDIYYKPEILNTKPLVIKLIVANPTKVRTSWSLKKILLCSCKQIAKSRGLSFKLFVYNCTHKSLCTIYPTSGTLEADEKVVINIEMQYTLLGENKIKWDLNVGYGRHIFLNFYITSLTGTEQELHFLYENCIDFGRVYFGRINPFSGVCWLRNNTNHNLSYSLDIKKLSNMNEYYRSEIFSCENPEDIVQSQSSHQIIVKFQPRQYGLFQVTLPIILGNKKSELTLKGEGFHDSISLSTSKFLSINYTLTNNEIPIQFSNNYFDVSPIPMHSSTVRMLMVHNVSSYLIAYKWKSYELPKTLYARIHPQKGLIQPSKILSFRVHITTYGNDIITDIDLPCEFINATEKREYNRSLLNYEILSKELEGQFIMTEKGTNIIEPWIKIQNKPKPFYKYLLIHCGIYNSTEESDKISSDEIFYFIPPEKVIMHEINQNLTCIERKELKLVIFILEGMIWDIINSKVFKLMQNKMLMKKPNLYYSQFKITPKEREGLIKRLYTDIPKRKIALLLEKMLFQILHEEFHLETIHLMQQSDIRDTSYMKVLSTAKKRQKSLDKFTKDTASSSSEHKIEKYPTSFRVSFLD